MDTLTPFNHLFLTGPNQEEIIRKDYFRFHPETEVNTMLHRIGYPKSDDLLTTTTHRDTIVQQYALEAGKPIIVYAPTWEQEASLAANGDEILAALTTLDASVLLRPHSNFMSKSWPRKDGRSWSVVLREFGQNHPNFRLVTDRHSDAAPYLGAADVLLADVSGVGFEYLLLNKPIVFWDCPAFFAKYGTQGIEFWGRTAGDLVKTVAELRDAVRRALADTNRYRQNREQLITKLVFNKGRAGTVAAQTILEILKHPHTSRGT